MRAIFTSCFSASAVHAIDLQRGAPVARVQPHKIIRQAVDMQQTAGQHQVVYLIETAERAAQS